MIGKTISHYRILDKLGEGGMGVVYRAEDTKLRRTVALKFLPPDLIRDPEAKSRFVREAQAASGLQHHNICTIHEIDETPEGQLFICMDYYEGETLKQKIARGPQSLVEAVGIVSQVAEGLSRAHQAGMVHRDIKPANVIVTGEGVVKIVDFGLAKLGDQTKLTRTGATVGTPAYMSPEQVGGVVVDHRTDIWSLGVVLYELLTGRLPFRAEKLEGMLYSILNEEPEPVTALRTGVPMELEHVIARCVEKNAEDRYQTADDLVSDLRRVMRVIAEPSARSRSAAIPSEAARPTRRWPWMAALAVIAVLAVVALRAHFSPSEKLPSRQPAEGRKMLVVLPFENLGPSEDEYFADGLTEEITSRLAAVHGLGVISRTSAGQYKDTAKNIKQIGDELGVDFVLEGTVRWDRTSGSESRVRITQQLIKVSDDTHLWAESYDRFIDDIFAVQKDIAEQVFQKLDVSLLEPERRALEAQPTVNLEAYEAYLRGLDYLGRAYESKEDALLAAQMFERAVELDPAFALAYTQLSLTYSLSYHFGHDRTEECLSNAKTAVDRALELAPELPDAHLALGYYHYRGYREYDLALEALAVAQESLPNDAGILEATGYVRRRQGHFEAALEDLLRSFELNPRSPGLAREVALTYSFLRKYEEADQYLGKSISLAPGQTFGYLDKATNYWLWEGDTEKARAALEEMPQRASANVIQSLFLQDILERDYTAALDRLSSTSNETFESGEEYIPKPLYAGLAYQLMDEPDLARPYYNDARVVLENVLKELPDDARVRSSLGIAYAGLGRKEDAIREGKHAVGLCPPSKDAIISPLRVRDLVYVYVMVGEYDAAMDQIEYLVSIPNYWLSVPFLRLDPRCDPLRSHARFQRLLEESSAAGLSGGR